MTTRRVVLASLSAAMDGGFTAIADISAAMNSAGPEHDHRLIGGTAVLLHVQRLGLDLPLRATGDADFGMAPHVLARPELAEAIEALGYTKTFGNRWERAIDDRRVAAVDLLVPAYTSHARRTVKIGNVTTTEVPGLATALRRPGVVIAAELRLTDGLELTTTVVLPDAVSTLGLKANARTVRDESRDADDLWRCLEIAWADGVTPETFDTDPALGRLRTLLWLQLGPGGTTLPALTRGLRADAAARRRTRIRALLAEAVGPPD